MTVFAEPVVKSLKLLPPIAVFHKPVVADCKLPIPIAVLPLPVEFLKAFIQIAIFSLPCPPSPTTIFVRVFAPIAILDDPESIRLSAF